MREEEAAQQAQIYLFIDSTDNKCDTFACQDFTLIACVVP